MRKIYSGIFILIFAAALQACEKSDTVPEPAENPKPADSLAEDSLVLYKRELLKGIQWKELNSRAHFEYNTDSSIRQIIYNGPMSSYDVSYDYVNRQLKEVNTAGSIYRNVYEYDAAGRVSNMIRYMQLGTQQRANQELEFIYLNNNRVSVMKYYQINEAGRELIYTNTYEYDTQNRPVKITGLDKNGNTIVTTIEAYSKVALFDPLYFTGTEINELYTIYNLPVISQLKQLPALIRSGRIRNGQLYVEKQTSITYTINKGRIEKQLNELVYPQHPNLNQSSEVNYSY